LDLLPEKEKPKVILSLGPKNANCGYEQEFSQFSFVQIEEREIIRDLSNRALSRVLGRGFGRKIFSLFSLLCKPKADQCTVAFPVKGPALRKQIESVLWIPDFQYKCLPEYFQPTDREQRDKLYAKMLSDDSILVLSSESVRADFLKYFPEYSHKRVHILHFLSLLTNEDYSIDPVTVCQHYGLPEKFVYLPNQFFQHKRHDHAFSALAKLKKSGIDIHLVCTGNPEDYRSPKYYNSLLAFLRSEEIEDRVSLLGLIPRSDQLQIFRRAAVVLQPSSFEGWSTTVEDGIALGKNVLFSDIATHIEQAPEYGSYFKSGNVDSLAQALEQQWIESKPGPQLDREASARIKNQERGLVAAKKFIEIMGEAHGLFLERYTGR
jgi:glycosyltransferase involved in cell wall biosynthesis